MAKKKNNKTDIAKEQEVETKIEDVETFVNNSEENPETVHETEVEEFESEDELTEDEDIEDESEPLVTSMLGVINDAIESKELKPDSKSDLKNKVAKKVFAQHSNCAKLYFTSDSIPFFSENDAIKHSFSLDDKTIVTKQKE